MAGWSRTRALAHVVELVGGHREPREAQGESRHRRLRSKDVFRWAKQLWTPPRNGRLRRDTTRRRRASKHLKDAWILHLCAPLCIHRLLRLSNSQSRQNQDGRLQPRQPLGREAATVACEIAAAHTAAAHVASVAASIHQVGSGGRVFPAQDPKGLCARAATVGSRDDGASPTARAV